MFVTALLAAALAAPVPKSLKVQSQMLDGRWEAVEVTADGKDVTHNNWTVWEVHGERLSRWDRAGNGTLRAIDKPYDVGLSRPSGSEAGEMEYTLSMLGQVMHRRKFRVTVEKNELVVCYHIDPDAPCPADLTGGQGLHRLRFRRIADDER